MSDSVMGICMLSITFWVFIGGWFGKHGACSEVYGTKYPFMIVLLGPINLLVLYIYDRKERREKCYQKFIDINNFRKDIML